MTALMHKLLIPVDGSPSSLRAVEHAATLSRAGLAAEIHLLNVQLPVGSNVADFVAKKTLSDYHREEGKKALAEAEANLQKASIAFTIHISVGAPGAVIAAFVRELNCDHVVMGSRGLGSALNLLMGSVASDVIENVDVPVTLVK